MRDTETTLVIGAAGQFAGMVVPALAKRGARIRGFIHDASRAAEVRSAGASEIAVGDLYAAETVREALRGVASVFFIAPAFMRAEAETGVDFVRAARDAGVRRIVFSSVIHPTLGALANHAAKPPVEEAIFDSNMEYTLLHPAMFFQNFADSWASVARTGTFAQPWSMQTRFSRVDYRDVAEVAAIAVTTDQLLYGTFELCAEGATSGGDVAQLMAEVMGRPVSAERQRPPEGSPADAQIPAPMKTMFDWYDEHGLLGNALTLSAILGRRPRTLRDYFEELNRAPAR